MKKSLTRAWVNLLAAAVALLLLTKVGAGHADDYWLDPAPKLRLSAEPEAYQAPRHPGVCSRYLLNLQHFARQRAPLSCGQPIAGGLAGNIKRMEWEDLDPDQHGELFKAAVWEFATRHYDEAAEAKLTEQARNRIKNKESVFRRANIELKGYPRFWKEHGKPVVETAFQIVQYGPDATNPNNPSEVSRCRQSRGRVMSDDQPRPVLFVVTADLRRIYDRLEDWSDAPPQTLWLIDGYPYAEGYNGNGDVRLSELRVEEPIHLEPVCLYHFKNTLKTKE